MSGRFIANLTLIIALAVTLLFFSKPLADGIAALILPKSAPTLTPLAQVTEIVGNAYLRRPKSPVESLKRELPIQIHHRDLIRVGTGSLVRLFFNGGAEVILLEDTDARMEFFNPADPLSPVYLSLRRGRLKFEKHGLPGRLFVIEDKKIFSPVEWERYEKVPTKVVHLTPPPTQTVRKKSDDKRKDESSLQERARAELAQSPIVEVGDQQTLSSKYIEEVLAQKAPQFRRCQINSIRDRLPALGQITLSIRIEPNGTVGQVTTVSSSIQNIHLHSCVEDVVERTRFRKFSGRPITLSYPIAFQ